MEDTVSLEEINKEMESFSFSVLDLRAPLRAIDGCTGMFLKKHGDRFDEDTVHKFNEIRANTQMVRRLIDDLFTFSHLDGKRCSSKRQRCWLQQAYRDKLFRLFQHLRNNPDFAGTGVSLAAVQRMVHRNGRFLVIWPLLFHNPVVKVKSKLSYKRWFILMIEGEWI